MTRLFRIVSMIGPRDFFKMPMPFAAKRWKLLSKLGPLLAATLLVMASGAAFQMQAARSDVLKFESKEQLGEALFFDVNLSKNRTQACATCHSPEAAFTDPRDNAARGAVSLGDDGHSLGDRNTPTASYAALTPAFQLNAEKKPVGGLFLDGRAATLEDQAGQPPLNPIEMGMPGKAAVVARLSENPAYATAFEALFGAGTLADTEKAYAAMSASLAAFERTGAFAPFDSKYDRYLRGEVSLTDEEELGRLLFFSNQFTNCSQCHQLKQFGGASGETFTNYQYHNIGVPENVAARLANGSKAGRTDHGLMDNPRASGAENDGKFKVPTLRNVAVTAPYMHNGVFKDLRTVVAFYNKYNSKNPRHRINPETSKPWREPEVAVNVSTKELTSGSALNTKRINALVAFLKALTDKRYEPLLEKK